MFLLTCKYILILLVSHAFTQSDALSLLEQACQLHKKEGDLDKCVKLVQQLDQILIRG